MAKTINDILAELNPLFREILEDETIQLKEESTADDIENWDSITNIQIIVSVEKHFKIRFSSKEIQGFKNAGEMCECIISKLQ